MYTNSLTSDDFCPAITIYPTSRVRQGSTLKTNIRDITTAKQRLANQQHASVIPADAPTILAWLQTTRPEPHA